MKDSAELIQQFILGNEQAFETLVFLHKDSGQQFAQRYVPDYHIAEDIVQDAFISCYLNRKKYKPTYSFKTYFYTIVRNKCIDHIRKQNKVILYNMSDTNTSISTEEKLIQKESLASLQNTINALHKPYKHAIYLVDIEGFNYKEAARIMEKTTAAFKVTLFRARKQLQKELSEEVSHESR